MRGRIFVGACAAAAVVGAAAHADTPGLSVSVSPTLVTIDGPGNATIDVSNPSDAPTVVDVATGNYAIERDGSVLVDPKLPPNRTAKAWISVRPRSLRLGPGAHAQVTVTAHPPAHAEPGDHHALVLLASPPGKGGQVAVRTQVGVGVLVRMPGAIERKLEIGTVRVRRAHGRRILSLRIANRGNVNELLAPGRVTLQLWQQRHRLATLTAAGYDLLPESSVTRTVVSHLHTRGIVDVVVTVRPLLAGDDGPGIAQNLPPLHQTFQVRW